MWINLEKGEPMWIDLEEFLFSKNSSNSPMGEQDPLEKRAIAKEVVNRMELLLLEEVKMTFGDYSKLFKYEQMDVHSSEKTNMIVTDYVDDEGIKELRITEIDMNKDVVAIQFKDTMKAGTFNISDMIQIKREVEGQILGVNLDYSDQDQCMCIVTGLYRDHTKDEATHAKMIMHSIREIEENLRRIMPVIRSKYGRK